MGVKAVQWWGLRLCSGGFGGCAVVGVEAVQCWGMEAVQWWGIYWSPLDSNLQAGHSFLAKDGQLAALSLALAVEQNL